MKKILIFCLILVCTYGCGGKRTIIDDTGKKLLDNDFQIVTGFGNFPDVFFLTENKCVDISFKMVSCPLNIDDGDVYLLIMGQSLSKGRIVYAIASGGTLSIMAYDSYYIDDIYIFYSTPSAGTLTDNDESKKEFEKWLSTVGISENDLIEYVKWCVVNFSEPLRIKMSKN